MLRIPVTILIWLKLGAVVLTLKVRKKMFPDVPVVVVPPRMVSAKEVTPGPSSAPHNVVGPLFGSPSRQFRTIAAGKPV